MRLDVDSELEMRRKSSDGWMHFIMDTKTLGYISPKVKDTTQDNCLYELSTALKN